MISPRIVRQGVSFLLEDLARTGTDKQLELALVDFKGNRLGRCCVDYEIGCSKFAFQIRPPFSLGVI